ncbi:MAG TPA: cellulase family glycosylhydrolase [Dissulfurispiraceae bacterium]
MEVLLLLIASFLLFPQDLAAERPTGFLKVSEGRVVDGSGTPVLLKGFNVEFRDFRGALGEEDIKRIAGAGANVIRLGLDYRSFEAAPFRYDEEGFRLLDSVLGWCERYGVYVILDMHLAQGIQNPHDFAAHRTKRYEFWKRREYRMRFYSLWAELAKRYADRGIIAGYDLLNEGVPPGAGHYRKVMQRAARAIRAHDKSHLLIVEEMRSPRGGKRLVPIEDANTLYSIHFYYPPGFTLYTTTDRRLILHYPGEAATGGDKIGEARTCIAAGSEGWRRISVAAVPPEGAEVLMVNIESSGNRGRVWFDDIALEGDGHSIDLPAPLVPNNSFEIDYPGFNWRTQGRGVGVTRKTAKTGTRSLLFDGNTAGASARGSAIEAGKGRYSLSAWVKSKDSTGKSCLSLSWHRKKIVGRVDKETLRKRFRYALEFRARHNAPLYVGEFGAHEYPDTGGMLRYLGDVLGIMEDSGMHWSFWTYYSGYPGIGLFTGEAPHLSRPAALDALKAYMK